MQPEVCAETWLGGSACISVSLPANMKRCLTYEVELCSARGRCEFCQKHFEERLPCQSAVYCWLMMKWLFC